MSLHITDAVIWQESAGGISLYHTETGEFRTLNPTAAKVWVLISDDGDRESVIAKLSLLYGGKNDIMGRRIRSEVDEFIDSMVAGGLLAETVTA